MDLINISNIKRLYVLKEDPKIFIKNIFYIKLLVYFEDIKFIEYMDIKSNCFLWIFNILYCLIQSKCSKKFIDKYVELYYINQNLQQRLKQINKIFTTSNNIKFIQLVKRLSFYEKDKYTRLSIEFGLSPINLLINKISNIDRILDLTLKYNRWDCLIDMYLSKYININILIKHLPKCIKFSNNQLIKPGKKINRLICTCEKIPELINSEKFLLELFGNILSVYNKKLKYHFIKLGTYVSRFFNSKLDDIILSNQKLCEKFIFTTSNLENENFIKSMDSTISNNY